MRKEERRPHLTLHTRIVLVSTASLLVLGTVLTLGLEYDHTLKDLNWEKLNASFPIGNRQNRRLRHCSPGRA